TLPASALCRSVIERFDRPAVVLDGTGADGAFGIAEKARMWRLLARIPRVLGAAAASIYERTGAYRRKGATEAPLRILRRRAQLPYPLDAISQNPLFGIAYRVSRQTKAAVDRLALDWLDRLCGPDPLERLAACDLALVCSSIFAQKSKSLFCGSRHEIRYPYLDSAMVRLGLESLHWPHTNRPPKWLLKAALARH